MLRFFWDLLCEDTEDTSPDDIPDTGEGVPGPTFTELVGVGDSEDIGEHIIFLGGDCERSPNISSSDDMI